MGTVRAGIIPKFGITRTHLWNFPKSCQNQKVCLIRKVGNNSRPCCSAQGMGPVYPSTVLTRAKKWGKCNLFRKSYVFIAPPNVWQPGLIEEKIKWERTESPNLQQRQHQVPFFRESLADTICKAHTLTAHYLQFHLFHRLFLQGGKRDFGFTCAFR